MPPSKPKDARYVEWQWLEGALAVAGRRLQRMYTHGQSLWWSGTDGKECAEFLSLYKSRSLISTLRGKVLAVSYTPPHLPQGSGSKWSSTLCFSTFNLEILVQWLIHLGLEAAMCLSRLHLGPFLMDISLSLSLPPFGSHSNPVCSGNTLIILCVCAWRALNSFLALVTIKWVPTPKNN